MPHDSRFARAITRPGGGTVWGWAVGAGQSGTLDQRLAAIGPGLATFFPMDPIATAAGAGTFSGQDARRVVHDRRAGRIVAVLLLSLALRVQPGWSGAPLLPIGAVIWISLAVMIAAMMLSMKSGMDGPGILGWANRLLMVAHAGWMGVTAWPLAR